MGQNYPRTGNGAVVQQLFLLCLYQTVTEEAVHQFFEELRAKKRCRTDPGYQ